MKIIGLEISNLRKIKAFECEFSQKGLIKIKGKNGQGKTTILDAFGMLFQGKKSIPQDVITHGEKSAQVIGKLDEYVIERRISEGNSVLKVTNSEDKAKVTKPQAFVEALVNELTFNPRPFLDKTPEQKKKFLIELLKIDVDTIEASLRELEAERTVVGRQNKALGEPVPVEKVEPVDVASLLHKKEDADLHNSKIDFISNSVSRKREAVRKTKERIEQLNAECEETLRKMKAQESELEKLGSKIDTGSIIQEISDSQEKNAQVQRYARYVQDNEMIKAKRNEYKALTKRIEVKRSEKQELLKNADIPVKGLEVREEGIYFNGINSENWSDSQSIQISYELAVAMQPKLQSIFIDRGESYDAESLKQLEAWAIENDVQAFITIVEDIDAETHGAIIIEQGK